MKRAMVVFTLWLITVMLAGFGVSSAFDSRWRDAGESSGAAVFAGIGALLLTRKAIEEHRSAKARSQRRNRLD